MENIKKEEIEQLIGIDKVNIFYDIIYEITKLYDMEQIWNNGGKKWTYEYKFRIDKGMLVEQVQKLLRHIKIHTTMELLW